MGIPTVGLGYQSNDGNLNEPKIGVMPAPQTATTSATLTAAQLLGGVLVGTAGTSAVTYTLPAVSVLEAAIGTDRKVGTSFDLTIINLGTSSGVITLAAGGFTLVGMATLPITTSAGSTGTWRFRKTGAGAWTAYRVA
jgi:hypothetical protein